MNVLEEEGRRRTFDFDKQPGSFCFCVRDKNHQVSPLSSALSSAQEFSAQLERYQVSLSLPLTSLLVVSRSPTLPRRRRVLICDQVSQASTPLSLASLGLTDADRKAMDYVRTVTNDLLPSVVTLFCSHDMSVLNLSCFKIGQRHGPRSLSSSIPFRQPMANMVQLLVCGGR